MSYFASTPPDITEGLPAALSARTTSQAAVAAGTKFDVFIGGIGFRLAVSQQRPYVRETADPKKPQFDASVEPGEQTLDQYWVRSETSWHNGAGIAFYEPGAGALNGFNTNNSTANRFEDSQGVDVWTQGQATLLHAMDNVGAVSPTQTALVTGGVVGGVDVLFTNENGTVRRRSGTGASLASYTGWAATPATAVCLSGTKILVGHSLGIGQADASGSTASTLWTQAAGVVPVPYWVKSRIIAAQGPSLYELTLAGGAMPTGAAALWTHPDAAWVWSSVAEAPQSILASGYANGVSAIYSFSLLDASSGATPKLGQAYQLAELPPGEEIRSMNVYLGRYVGIGTNRGVRVGSLESNGTITMGPRLVDTTSAVTGLAGHDHFLYAAVTTDVSGKASVLRVDVNNVIGNTLLFPYAWDAQSHATGTASSLAMLGSSSRVALGVTGVGTFLQSATKYETQGFIRSGRIRYSTVEPKAFRLADVRAQITDGTMVVEFLDPAGTATFVASLGAQESQGLDLPLSQVLGDFEYAQLRITLHSPVDQLSTPALESWQVKALPRPRPQYLVQIPLLCADQESDRNNVGYGAEGFARDRIAGLRALAQEGVTVLVQDVTAHETYTAVIEKLSFQRTTPPSEAYDNYGGFVTLTVREL